MTRAQAGSLAKRVLEDVPNARTEIANTIQGYVVRIIDIEGKEHIVASQKDWPAIRSGIRRFD